MPTVVRYERNRKPNPASLAQLDRLAASEGHHDLAWIFREALVHSLTPAPAKSGPTPGESAWIDVFLRALRDEGEAATAVRQAVQRYSSSHDSSSGK